MPLIILAVLLCIVSVSFCSSVLLSLIVGRDCFGARDCSRVPSAGSSPSLVSRRGKICQALWHCA